MSPLLYLVSGAVSLYVIIYYSVFRGARCSSPVKLTGRTAVVTGNETHLSTPAKMLASFVLHRHFSSRSPSAFLKSRSVSKK